MTARCSDSDDRGCFVGVDYPAWYDVDIVEFYEADVRRGNITVHYDSVDGSPYLACAREFSFCPKCGGVIDISALLAGNDDKEV